MPANARWSSETIDIGRGNHYEPSKPHLKPVRRSSTLMSEERDYYRGKPVPNFLRDDPRYEVSDVYDRLNRPAAYRDNDYYDRWQEGSGPVPRYVPPAQSQVVGVRPRPRSPSPVRYDHDRRMIIPPREIIRAQERIRDRERYEEERKPEDMRMSTSASAAAHIDAEMEQRKLERLKRELEELRIREERDAAMKLETGSQHIPGLFQTIFDVNHPQDASVHLELPIIDDYDAELEEFCRLQRLGNFAAAEEYFKEKLEPYLNNPYVFVQYAQMLLEKGDYLAFERLNPEAVFGKDNGRPSLIPEDVKVVRDERPIRIRVPSRSRFQSRTRSRSRSRERRRETRVRSRSRTPTEGDRQERRARFDSDRRLVRRRSRSRSVENVRRYYERERDVESDRASSPDRAPQSQDTKHDIAYNELQLLRQNWRLLKAMFTIHSKGTYDDAWNEALHTIQEFRVGTNGSTEIQVVKLTLQLCAYFERIAHAPYLGYLREDAKDWVDWPTLFKDLLSQGRIWDFKDVNVAVVAAFYDPNQALYFRNDDFRRSLIDDWVVEEGDESTNLALLDILLEVPQLRSRFPDETKSRAEAIIAHSPTAMRSRSFIRWILTNAADAMSAENGDDGLWTASKTHLQGFPGMVWNTEGCFLPGIYVPRNTENPGWAITEGPLGLSEPIHLALNLAKELKDYKAQVACYKLLIFQSQDPTQLFQELARLQKSVQGDKTGHLETLLPSYMVCKDRSSKEKLLEELELTDEWGESRVMRNGLIYWARDFVERAVKRSLQGPKSTAGLRNPAKFYIDKGIPPEAERFTWENTKLDRQQHASDTYPIRQVTSLSSQPSVRAPGHRSSMPSSEPYIPPPPLPISCGGVYEQSLGESRQQRRIAGDEAYRASAEREYARDREQERKRQSEREREAALDRAEKERRLAEEDAIRARVAMERRRAEEEEEAMRVREDNERRELARVKAELHLKKEKRDRESRNDHDRKLWERLEQAERRLREQEELSKKQTEEMKRRDIEIARIEKDFEREKRKQELEVRAQQDRETRERLERLDLSLRDQAKRLRRAEDRPYQEWLAGRDLRHETKSHGRFRSRRWNRFAASTASSEYYSDESSLKRDDDDSSDDSSTRKKRRNNVTSSDDGDETVQEVRLNRRARSLGDLRGESRRSRRDDCLEDGAGIPKYNSCTDLILYSGVDNIRSPDTYTAESPLPRLPTSPAPESDQGRGSSRRSSTVEQEHNPEQTPTYPEEQSRHLTAEPEEVEDELDQPEPPASGKRTVTTRGPEIIVVTRDRPREDSERQSQKQNEKIASRPSLARPASTSAYASPRQSLHESTSLQDELEDLGMKRDRRRVIIDPGPSSARTISPTPRSRPSSTHVYDDIHPPSRRTSWRDSPTASPRGERLEGAPTKRRSLIIDADGRPQPMAVRTTSETSRSYAGGSPSGTYASVVRSNVADRGRSIPSISPAAAGLRSRPRSTGDVGSRTNPRGPVPIPTIPERSSDESREMAKDSSRRDDPASTLHEDPEEEEEEENGQGSRVSDTTPAERETESLKSPEAMDPEQGISRKSTVTDPGLSEE